MNKKAITKITKWGLPLMLWILLFTYAISAEIRFLPAEPLIKDTTSIINVSGYMHRGGETWMGEQWIDDIDDPEIREFLYRMLEELGPALIPLLILFGTLAVTWGFFGFILTLIFSALLFFIIIKLIQFIVRGSAEVEADAIGVYVYYLYLVGILIQFMYIPGIIIAYMYQGKSSEWMKSHYRFQIRTFWISILYLVSSSILIPLFIGFLGYIFIIVWILIRSVQGIRAFNRSQPIAKPATWLWN